MTKSSTPTAKLYIEVKETLSCDYHRIVLPYRYLGKVTTKVPVLWLNRYSRHGIGFLKRQKARGVKIVVDIDDDFDLDINHNLYHYWNNSGIRDSIIESLKLADRVTVTTARLADKIRLVNKNIEIIPNALPFDQDQFCLSKNFSSTKAIYVAGPSHNNDVAWIEPSDDVTIACLGHKGFKRKDCQPLKSYMSLYDGHRLALAPLVKNSFNECKSNLKLLEAGAKGIPLLASKCLPYYNKTDKGITLFAETPAEFNKIIKSASVEFLEEAGQATAEHVRRHYHIKDSNKIRKQIFESFR